VKFTRITTVFAATAIAGLVCAPIVSADAAEPAAPSTQSLGSQAKLVNGDVIQGWTISNLKPSSDTIPHQVSGTLWEATATDAALQGSVTPIVSNFNARAADGQTYRALFGVATPQGVNPSTIAQGDETSGKVYFDVTGSAPTSVVYNAGGQDLLIWNQPAPSSTGSTYKSYPATGPATAAPAGTTADAPEGTVAAPTATGAEVPAAGSQGTPLPEGTQGNAVPAGSQGTPLPEGSQGTPATPAEGAPVPAASQGTPAPEGGEQVPPTPTTYLPTP
jgi:hypothetical protein